MKPKDLMRAGSVKGLGSGILAGVNATEISLGSAGTVHSHPISFALKHAQYPQIVMACEYQSSELLSLCESFFLFYVGGGGSSSDVVQDSQSGTLQYANDRNTKATGLGFILRDSNGEFVAAMESRWKGYYHPKLAEAIGIRL
nr:uncharacterized protein LOC109155154 [Ipomoea batatas]